MNARSQALAETSVNLIQRGRLVAVAAAAYLVGFWPTWWVRDLVLGAFNNPPYEGLWILIPHLFLYTTVQALFCLAAWSVLARLRWMPALRLSLRLATLGWGLTVGLASIAVLVALPNARKEKRRAACHSANLLT